MKPRLTPLAMFIVFFTFPIGGLAVGKYAVTKKVVEGHTTYHLIDSTRKMDFGLVPDIGNFGYEFKVNGKDVLIPPESFESYIKQRWFCCGNPFLAPWANRIDQDYYYFQDKKYLLNDALGNILRDQFKQAIHGLLVFDPRWEVTKTGASPARGAYIVSRFEFWKYPDLMAQFPFAHILEVTHRLRDGKLEVATKVTNLGRAAMPIMMAYHPYFRPDGEHEEWIVSNAARNYWVLSNRLIPTGEKGPTETLMPDRKNFVLGKNFPDNLFSDLERGADGLGHVWVKGRTQKIEVVYSKEFDFAVIYAPLDKTLICIEPQTGPTNAFNLNHEGKYPELPVLEPGKVFKATFWIIPSGF